MHYDDFHRITNMSKDSTLVQVIYCPLTLCSSIFMRVAENVEITPNVTEVVLLRFTRDL